MLMNYVSCAESVGDPIYDAHKSPPFDGKVFLHPSCEPLETVDFASRMRTKQPSLFDNECEGMCGV